MGKDEARINRYVDTHVAFTPAFPLLTSLSHVRTRWWSGGGYGGEFDGVKEKICSGDPPPPPPPPLRVEEVDPLAVGSRSGGSGGHGPREAADRRQASCR